MTTKFMVPVILLIMIISLIGTPVTLIGRAQTQGMPVNSNFTITLLHMIENNTTITVTCNKFNESFIRVESGFPPTLVTVLAGFNGTIKSVYNNNELSLFIKIFIPLFDLNFIGISSINQSYNLTVNNSSINLLSQVMLKGQSGSIEATLHGNNGRRLPNGSIVVDAYLNAVLKGSYASMIINNKDAVKLAQLLALANSTLGHPQLTVTSGSQETIVSGTVELVIPVNSSLNQFTISDNIKSINNTVIVKVIIKIYIKLENLYQIVSFTTPLLTNATSARSNISLNTNISKSLENQMKDILIIQPFHMNANITNSSLVLVMGPFKSSTSPNRTADALVTLLESAGLPKSVKIVKTCGVGGEKTIKPSGYSASSTGSHEALISSTASGTGSSSRIVSLGALAVAIIIVISLILFNRRK